MKGEQTIAEPQRQVPRCLDEMHSVLAGLSCGLNELFDRLHVVCSEENEPSSPVERENNSKSPPLVSIAKIISEQSGTVRSMTEQVNCILRNLQI